MYQNLPFFMKNRKRNDRFLVKNLVLLASDKQLKTPLSIWRSLDTKKQVLEAYILREHNLQHAYAPKCAIFNEKKATNGFFLAKN